MKEQTVIAISGVKNSGKTTLIQRILPKLTAEGLNVAVIKHDGHTFQADPVDTDTGKYIEAGAYGTAIFDGEKYKIIKCSTIDGTMCWSGIVGDCWPCCCAMHTAHA